MKLSAIRVDLRVAMVDVWDALLPDRPYRPAWTREQALSRISQRALRDLML